MLLNGNLELLSLKKFKFIVNFIELVVGNNPQLEISSQA
jgi:hypothetical protein